MEFLAMANDLNSWLSLPQEGHAHTQRDRSWLGDGFISDK